MENAAADLVPRFEKLGLACDDLPLDRVSSAAAALACFPMYMVANVHAWTDEKQWKTPIVDLPGFESLRESMAIGKQEAQLPLEKQHSQVLATLLSSAKPSDRVIYEYALDTLRSFLNAAEPAVTEELRTAVARMVMAVAKSAGKGLFGTGTKITPAERECIAQIAEALNLRAAPDAAKILAELNQ